MARTTNPPKIVLYDANGNPEADFNKRVLQWLNGVGVVKEHQPLKAFASLRTQIDVVANAVMKKGESKQDAYKTVLNILTKMMLGIDLQSELRARLDAETINDKGFRSALSQGVAKNNGENFVNAIVYCLCRTYEDSDEILIDKGCPPRIKKILHLKRIVPLLSGEKTIEINVECDFAIFSRRNPERAIALSAKTRLKEVFHIGTMWKLFFDTIGDPVSLEKWSLRGHSSKPQISYCFATADMIPEGGAKTQGPDVPCDSDARNLIQMDASFFDYVYVSKTGSKIASAVNIRANKKEGLFHSMGCLIDHINQYLPSPQIVTPSAGIRK